MLFTSEIGGMTSLTVQKATLISLGLVLFFIWSSKLAVTLKGVSIVPSPCPILQKLIFNFHIYHLSFHYLDLLCFRFLILTFVLTIMPAVFCPLCEFRVEGGLDLVTPHIQNAHEIFVSDPYPDGFTCKQPGCRVWFAVYKSWRRHIRDDHGGGLDDEAEFLGGAGGQGEVQDVNNVEPEAAMLGGAPVQGGINVDLGPHGIPGNAQDQGFEEGLEGGPMDVGVVPDDVPAPVLPAEGVGVAGGEGHVSSAEESEGSSDRSEEVGGAGGDRSGSGGDSSEEMSVEGGSDSEEMSEDSRGSDDSGGLSGAESDDGVFEGNNANLKELAVDMIVNLRSHCTMNRTEVRLAMGGCDSLLRGYSENAADRVRDFLDRNNFLGNRDAEALLASLQFSSPFNGIRSDKGQVSGTKDFYRYIDPQPMDLGGGRVEPVNVGQGHFRQRPVREKCQYVPPKEILKLLLTKGNVMDYINNLEPRDDGLLTSYIDGDYFRTHPFFTQYPKAFQLVLYYDEFEVVCKKGTKCLIHTIAAFYLLVLNVPPHMNSALNSIHVVLLANYDDLKSNGFRLVLQPLLNDLAELESPAGVRVVVDGQPHILRASLVAFIGDTKAAHEIFEFLGAGARHFCRLCMISRQQLHMGDVVLAQRRSRQLHEEHLQMIEENPGNRTLCGLAGNSCLHDLNHFNYWHNYVFDVFHDLVGIAHLVIRVVLRKFVCVEGYFRAVDLNRRIRSFNYGLQDIKNRPTANLSHENLRTALRSHVMKQNGSQTFCMLRALPFLLDGFVPDEEDDPYLELLVLLQKVVELALAPKLHRTIIPYYYQVLEDYRRSRRQLFPDVNCINKEHHIEHYPECTLKMGPMKVYWCMRCEGKHRPLRRHVVCCNSYRDACKTAIEAAQFAQAQEWGSGNPTINAKVQVISKVALKTVDTMLTHNLLINRGFNADDVLRTVPKVSVNGLDYNVNQFVVTRPASENKHGILSFAKIRGIILANDDSDVWLELEEWDTVGFDERLNSYVISPIQNANINLRDSDTLPLHPQLSAWNDYTTDRLYMSLKHLVV